MPIYEYCCQKCGLEFEQLLLDRNASVQCPECGSSDPKKKMSVFAHKSDAGFTPSSGGGSSCNGCSSGVCTGCHK